MFSTDDIGGARDRATIICPMDTTDTTELEYAGFWLRVWASLIDSAIVMLIALPLLTWIYGSAYWDGDSFIQGPVDFLISWVLPAVAVVLFWLARQATPGKMAIAARIVDARTGGKPTTSQLVIRYIGYFVSMIPFGLGILWVAFDSRKQGWHDKMAGTVVVRRRGGNAAAVKFENP